MKILLINSNRYKDPFPVIPIGLCYVASALQNEGNNVKVLDLCFSDNPHGDIKNEINDFKPGIIGITVRNIDSISITDPCFLIDDVKKEIILPCKKYFKGPIVIGGTAVGINGLEILKYCGMEYAIYSDGERTFLDFIEAYKNKKPFTGIKGLIINNGKISKINPPAYIKNLDLLNFPKPYKFLDLKKYRESNSPLQIQTKRGCALKCVYCTYNKIEGAIYRLRSPELIVDEIEDLVKNTGVKDIEFVDSTFNLPMDHAKAILKEIIKRKLKLRLSAMGIHPNGMDEEFAELLKQSGFYEVFVSVESCAEITLKSMNKGFSKHEIFNTARLLHDKHIAVHWCLLLGAPGESLETLNETFAAINKAASMWDIIDIGVGIRIYKGAPIIKYLKNFNSKDNFFKPLGFIPEKISLDKINSLAFYNLLRKHNYFIHNKSISIPFFIKFIFKIFLPRQPIWKGLIATRLLLNLTGIPFLIVFLYRLLNKIKG